MGGMDAWISMSAWISMDAWIPLDAWFGPYSYIYSFFSVIAGISVSSCIFNSQVQFSRLTPGSCKVCVRLLQHRSAMPYRTALIHSNENKFHFYARLKMRPLQTNIAPFAFGFCKIMWATPNTDKFIEAGLFKWREEGNQKPPLNKSMPGSHTGWAYVDTGSGQQYVSWTQMAPTTIRWHNMGRANWLQVQKQSMAQMRRKSVLASRANWLQDPAAGDSTPNLFYKQCLSALYDAHHQVPQSATKSQGAILDHSAWQEQWTQRAKELQMAIVEDDDSDDDDSPKKRQKISEASLADLRERKTRHLLVNLEEISFGGPRGLRLCFERQFIKPLNPSP